MLLYHLNLQIYKVHKFIIASPTVLWTTNIRADYITCHVSLTVMKKNFITIFRKTFVTKPNLFFAAESRTVTLSASADMKLPMICTLAGLALIIHIKFHLHPTSSYREITWKYIHST